MNKLRFLSRLEFLSRVKALKVTAKALQVITTKGDAGSDPLLAEAGGNPLIADAITRAKQIQKREER